MKYLLDTHTVIWHFDDSVKLSQKAIEITDNPESRLYICSVSLWEIAIKINLGKLNLNFTFDKLLTAVKESDVDILQIEDEHLRKLPELPYIHKDPFDRLIMATALAEDLTIVTIDENIQKYDIPWIW
jgi:PIN domain nuclease of toxin-antitoxin system